MTFKRTNVTLAVASLLAVAFFSVAAVDAAAQKKERGGKGKKESLVLDLTSASSAISAAGFGPFIKLYAFDPDADTYTLSWKNKQLKGRRFYDSAWIGDVDNDEVDEVIGFSGNLSIYESGSTGDFSYFSGSLNTRPGSFNPVMVGDVDDDNVNEVVVNLGDRVEV